MWTKAFWQAAAERAIRTFAQSFVAAVPVTALTLGEVNWIVALSTAALATALSVATNIGWQPTEVALAKELASTKSEEVC